MILFRLNSVQYICIRGHSNAFYLWSTAALNKQYNPSITNMQIQFRNNFRKIFLLHSFSSDDHMYVMYGRHAYIHIHVWIHTYIHIWYILLVSIFVKKGYGLVSARSQLYHTSLREASHITRGLQPRVIWLASRRHQAVSLFYKEGNEFIISPPPPPLPTYLYCWQWANYTMGPNGQNQHFA